MSFYLKGEEVCELCGCCVVITLQCYFCHEFVCVNCDRSPCFMFAIHACKECCELPKVKEQMKQFNEAGVAQR